MTTGTGDGVAPANAQDFARAWRQLRADGDIQFAPVDLPKKVQEPNWLDRLLHWLGDLLKPVAEGLGRSLKWLADILGLSEQVVLWLLLGLGAILVGWMVWRVGRSVQLPQRRAPEAAPEWTPDQDEAMALLEDADRLAAEGRFDEATHLLLKRSVGQIAAARPGLLEPSSTAREIAELPDLSDRARGAFATIATRVERSLFALRSLSADDWSAARAAYADFALAPPLAA